MHEGLDHGLVRVLFFTVLDDFFADPVDELEGNKKDYNRDQQLDTGVYRPVHNGFENVIPHNTKFLSLKL